ncbi:SGNH hydrolase-type esterase domain-containing protein [Aspergillus avenaceus]|uniref:SGNH hydrolase-type esterase domain-containing protein n=1 Tax=Aspergillus avenaceus TaxID=36643 RepID=A0A5N6TXL9_ASPAV|nr:SGNH hydrolase-type esterase domain-containing protein [Aspergillus avenaceus]
MSDESEALYKPYDQFILFGDSITQQSSNPETGFGIHGALQNDYIRHLDVINRGFSGYNTAHALKVFPKFFPTPERATVRIMVIFFGANDACVPSSAQHVPLDVYKENLKTIIQHPATVAQNPRIVLLTPTPVDQYQLQGFDESKGSPHPSRTASHTKLYAEAVREVGSSLGVPVADVWSAFMSAVGWKEGETLPGSRDLPEIKTFRDSLPMVCLHLTADGYQVVYDTITEAIRVNWPDQQPAQLRMIHPGWLDAPK